MRTSSQAILAISLMVALSAAALLPRTARAETPMGVASLAEAKAMYERNVADCRRDAGSEDRRACMLEAARAYDEAKREAMRQQRSRTQRSKPVAAAHQEQ